MSGDIWETAAPAALDGLIVWSVDIAVAAGATTLPALLSPEEVMRAGRFLRREDRDRHVVSHAALRVVLARALGAAAQELIFAQGLAGKPELSGAWEGRLSFNLSHSGGCALIGVAPSGRIGVDVEVVRPLPDHASIAQAHFAPSEVAALRACPPEAAIAAFYACWTRKEAFVKALGLGLSMPLDRFAVAVPPAPTAVLAIESDPLAARLWTLIHLEPMAGHVGAAAIDAPDARCRRLRLNPDWPSRAS